MITDLVGGRVQVAFDVLATSLPHIRSGGLRALAVASRGRFTCCRRCRPSPRRCRDTRRGPGPGSARPPGMPAQIIDRLNREINAGLATADIRARLSDVGAIPMIFSAAEFGACVAAEAEKWDKVAKFAGIKPE